MLGVKTVEFFFSKNYYKTVVMSAANQWLNTVNSPLCQSVPKLPIRNFTSPIIHLVCLPKLCITFVFNFHWVLQWPQEKKKTMLMQNYGGQTRCIMGDMQTTNCCLCANPKHPTFSNWKYLKSQKAVWWTFVHLNKIVHSRKPTLIYRDANLWRSKIRRLSFLYCTSPQNASPKIMTWELIKTLYKVLHELHSI